MNSSAPFYLHPLFSRFSVNIAASCPTQTPCHFCAAIQQPHCCTLFRILHSSAPPSDSLIVSPCPDSCILPLCRPTASLFRRVRIPAFFRSAVQQPHRFAVSGFLGSSVLPSNSLTASLSITACVKSRISFSFLANTIPP